MTTTGTTTPTAILVVRSLELLGEGRDEGVVVAEATEFVDELDAIRELLPVTLDTIELNGEFDVTATPVAEATTATCRH